MTVLLRICLALFGFGIVIALAVLTLSSADVAVMLGSWAVPAAAAIYLVEQAGCGFAWRIVVEPPRPSRRLFFCARWVRASVAALTPASGVGGAIAAVRVAVLAGLSFEVASASLVLDATVEMLTQIIFTVLGLSLLLVSVPSPGLIEWALAGVALTILLLAAFIGAQRAGGLKLLEAALSYLGDRWPRMSSLREGKLHDRLMLLHRRRAAVIVSGAYHLGSWLLGAGEIWVVTLALGRAPTPANCLIIESLSMTARSAGFFIPAALGVQEVALVLVGNVVGLSPETAMLVAVVKRLRDLATGVPALLVWQWLEGRRFQFKASGARPEMPKRCISKAAVESDG